MIQQAACQSTSFQPRTTATPARFRVAFPAAYGESTNREDFIIDAAINGDPGAMDLLTAQYRSVIHGALARLSLTSEEREDMLQDVFVHLLDDDARRLKQWRRSGKFAAYLSTLAYHLALQRLRSSKARPEYRFEHIDDRKFASVGDRSSRCPYEDVWNSYMVGIIDRYVSQLPCADADIIRRRHVFGESYREIAEGRQMTVTHVGVALLRAGNRLRDMLRQDHPDLFEN